MIYEIYRIRIYYRFLYWLIPISSTEKIRITKVASILGSKLEYPVSIEDARKFLNCTVILSGSKKFSIGYRIRVTVQ